MLQPTPRYYPVRPKVLARCDRGFPAALRSAMRERAAPLPLPREQRAARFHSRRKVQRRPPLGSIPPHDQTVEGTRGILIDAFKDAASERSCESSGPIPAIISLTSGTWAAARRRTSIPFSADSLPANSTYPPSRVATLAGSSTAFGMTVSFAGGSPQLLILAAMNCGAEIKRRTVRSYDCRDFVRPISTAARTTIPRRRPAHKHRPRLRDSRTKSLRQSQFFSLSYSCCPPSSGTDCTLSRSWRLSRGWLSAAEVTCGIYAARRCCKTAASALWTALKTTRAWARDGQWSPSRASSPQ